MPDPFAVDVERALDALVAAWGPAGYDGGPAGYGQIWHHEGAGWGAAHQDAADDDVVAADTPDELAAKIRQDWQARQIPDGSARKYLY